jgi:hypothetical protein
MSRRDRTSNRHHFPEHFHCTNVPSDRYETRHFGTGPGPTNFRGVPSGGRWAIRGPRSVKAGWRRTARGMSACFGRSSRAVACRRDCTGLLPSKLPSTIMPLHPILETTLARIGIQQSPRHRSSPSSLLLLQYYGHRRRELLGLSPLGAKVATGNQPALRRLETSACVSEPRRHCCD